MNTCLNGRVSERLNKRTRCFAKDKLRARREALGSAERRGHRQDAFPEARRAEPKWVTSYLPGDEAA